MKVTMRTPASSVIRQHRLAHGLTQAELASRVGVVRSYITNVELGEFMPSVDVAKRLGKALGFPWAEIYGD